jgi:hypothetical protein
MNKIEASLEAQMNLHPERVLKEGTDAHALNPFKGRALMHNILCASLKADELRVLSEVDGVLTIEPDEPVKVL